MPVKRTPPINARGQYILAAPWTCPATAIYTCKAIRSFRDIEEKGENVFETYYETMALSEATYRGDALAAANIITLMMESYTEEDLAEGRAYIYVPDTYITKFPDTSNVDYSHIILSVSVGPVPDSLNLTVLKDAIVNLVEEAVGATPIIKENRASSSGFISITDHAALEISRTAGLELLETDNARNHRLQVLVDELNAKNAALVAILAANSLWPPP